MNRSLYLLVVVALCGCNGDGMESISAAPEPAPPPKLQAPPKVTQTPAYELIQNSGPLVVLMATDMHSTLYGSVMDTIPSELIGAGYSLLALDLPCHGADAGTSSPLSCWRHRIEGGDTEIFTRFCAGLSAVLDEIGATEVSVVGQSRGGYMAVTCAAYDLRIRNLALIMPVTDLQRLYEFDGYTVDEAMFGVDQYLPYIEDRDMLVRISKFDDRVGTDLAVSFADRAHAELQLVDEPGHSIADDGHTAAWLLGHVK